jgi:hypothetical protein
LGIVAIPLVPFGVARAAAGGGHGRLTTKASVFRASFWQIF